MTLGYYKSLLHAARGANIQGLLQQFQESLNPRKQLRRVSASLIAEQRGSCPVANSYSAALRSGEYNLTTLELFW